MRKQGLQRVSRGREQPRSPVRPIINVESHQWVNSDTGALVAVLQHKCTTTCSGGSEPGRDLYLDFIHLLPPANAEVHELRRDPDKRHQGTARPCKTRWSTIKLLYANGHLSKSNRKQQPVQLVASSATFDDVIRLVEDSGIGTKSEIVSATNYDNVVLAQYFMNISVIPNHIWPCQMTSRPGSAVLAGVVPSEADDELHRIAHPITR